MTFDAEDPVARARMFFTELGDQSQPRYLIVERDHQPPGTCLNPNILYV